MRDTYWRLNAGKKNLRVVRLHKRVSLGLRKRLSTGLDLPCPDLWRITISCDVKLLIRMSEAFGLWWYQWNIDWGSRSSTVSFQIQRHETWGECQTRWVKNWLYKKQCGSNWTQFLSFSYPDWMRRGFADKS